MILTNESAPLCLLVVVDDQTQATADCQRAQEQQAEQNLSQSYSQALLSFRTQESYVI